MKLENRLNSFTKIKQTDVFSKIKIKSKGKTVHLNEYDHQTVECPICNREIQPYWEPRYNGVRAKCNKCGVNWAES